MKSNSRLLILLAFSLALRVLYLGSREIWYDDAFSILLSGKTLSAIVSGTSVDTMPPLYYFLLHFWMLAGHGLVWIRLLNVFLSLGVVGLLYGVVSALFDTQTGLWAALLAAISPFQIYHAQEVRMYTLLAFALLGYTWFFIRIWQHSKQESVKNASFRRGRADTIPFVRSKSGSSRKLPSIRSARLNWIGLVVFGTAALYTHNLAVFSLVALDGFLLLRRQWRLLGRLVAAQALMALLFLPWLVFVPGQISKIQTAFWTPRPGLVELIQTVIQFNASMPLPALSLIAAAVLSFAILTMIAIEGLRKSERSIGLGLLAVLALVPPALLFAVSYLMRPVFVPRGMILSSLAYYGIAGAVIARPNRKGIGSLLAVLFVMAAMISMPYQYQYSQFPRSPFRQALAYLQSSLQPGDVVVHDNKLSFFPMDYYDPALPQTFVADTPGSHNDTLALQSQAAMNLFAQPDLEQAVGVSSRIYFVVFSETIQEYTQQGLAGHPSLAWFESRYQQVDRRAFNDLEVYTFARP